jgi:hypothetical protein
MRLTASHGPAQSRRLDNRYSSEHRNHHLVPSSSTLKHRKRLIVCIADLSPETVSRCASAVLITKYGSAHSHILDHRFAAQPQQHLEFPISAASCLVPPTHLIAASTIPILFHMRRDIHVQIHILIHVDFHIQVHIQLRIRLSSLLHVHFRVLLVAVTFIRIVLIGMFHFLRWFCPSFAFDIFPFAPSPKDAGSSSGLCDGGRSWVIGSEKSCINR